MFLYKLEFKELENNIEIIKYLIDENSNTIVQKDFLNYEIILTLDNFQILIKNLLIREDTDFKILEYNLTHYDIENIVKVHIFSKDVFLKIKEFSKEKKINIYELDLNPTFRYLIDNEIKIENFEITPKMLFFDIETITKEDENLFDEIISISIFSPTGIKKVLLNTEFLDNEKISKIKRRKI